MYKIVSDSVHARHIVFAPVAKSVCTMTLENEVPFCTKSLPTLVVLLRVGEPFSYLLNQKEKVLPLPPPPLPCPLFSPVTLP